MAKSWHDPLDMPDVLKYANSEYYAIKNSTILTFWQLYVYPYSNTACDTGDQLSILFQLPVIIDPNFLKSRKIIFSVTSELCDGCSALQIFQTLNLPSISELDICVSYSHSLQYYLHSNLWNSHNLLLILITSNFYKTETLCTMLKLGLDAKWKKKHINSIA